MSDIVRDDTITLGPEDYRIEPEPRMVGYHEWPKFTLRGLVQFAAWLPLWAGLQLWATQVHPPWVFVPVILVGLVLAAVSARDFERTHPGAWRRFFRALGSFLGAVLLVFAIRALLHAAFGDHDRD